jgi:hypothetical protein
MPPTARLLVASRPARRSAAPAASSIPVHSRPARQNAAKISSDLGSFLQTAEGSKMLLPHRGLGLAMLAAATLPAASAFAFEVPAGEKDKLKACERTLCEIILKKETAGPDLSCALSKTWAKDTIKEGIEAKSINWSLGDARCGVDLSVSREAILKSLTERAYELVVPEHQIKCQVEREGDVTDIKLSLAPKLLFEGGRTTTVHLGVGNIEAPAVIKGAIWTVAKLEETFGLFHGELVEEINEFVEKKCAKRYGAAAE